MKTDFLKWCALTRMNLSFLVVVKTVQEFKLIVNELDELKWNFSSVFLRSDKSASYESMEARVHVTIYSEEALCGRRADGIFFGLDWSNEEKNTLLAPRVVTSNSPARPFLCNMDSGDLSFFRKAYV